MAGDLKQKSTKEVHRREFVEPRLRIEVGPLLNEPTDHRIHLAEVFLGALKLRLPLFVYWL